MNIVNNVRVYDLKESLIAAGYPMRTEVPVMSNLALGEKDFKRASNLIKVANADTDAHCQFLSGIRVAFDLTFSNKAWVELERYRFITFVSSQSTMHRILKFNLDTAYNEYVDPRVVDIMKDMVDKYNSLTDNEEKKQQYLRILYTNPSGFQLTARLSTNYRCLRNVYKQRKNHRLPEWREFCKWIETLPYAKELLMK